MEGARKEEHGYPSEQDGAAAWLPQHSCWDTTTVWFPCALEPTCEHNLPPGAQADHPCISVGLIGAMTPRTLASPQNIQVGAGDAGLKDGSLPCLFYQKLLPGVCNCEQIQIGSTFRIWRSSDHHKFRTRNQWL